MSGQSVDPVDTMLNMDGFENVSHYSPELSPSSSHKSAFIARPSSQATTPIMPQMASQMSGPSHQYDLYKQQTGIVPGALASTLASVNVNAGMPGFSGSVNMDYMGGMTNDPLFGFNNAPSQAMNPSELGLDFQSQTNEFFFDNAMAPSVADSASIASQPIVPSQSGNVRYYPGMHKQAALMKEQQRQRQQQQQATSARPRSKSNQPTDPIVEQKITQLLNSMRAKTSATDVAPESGSLNLPKLKKEEEDMDEDERLLASEEGKKLSSKERRQLRNKVSARAFRSRRKEYISHLEAEISNKVAENGDLRAENRSLMEENKRLSDLTRMLLSSPSFSSFLNNLSADAMAAEAQVQTQIPQEIKQEHSQQMPKDVGQYAASIHSQQLTMIPEQNAEFTMNPYEGSEPSLYNVQPQVFALTELPELPASFTESLSGKQSNFAAPIESESDESKIEIPAIESIREKVMAPEAPVEAPVNAEFEANPEFALFNSSFEDAVNSEECEIDIFGGVAPEKVLARYEFVDAEEEERNATFAMARIERLSDILNARMNAVAHMVSE
ncbi:bZIP transcription factor [Ceratocystis lukuohia]|uniref:BZIP transcription factor n=1 Tax=Ceratocystis lukuohia TaxID=2019550 RepID=A0ABR4MSC2_9PEZI